MRPKFYALDGLRGLAALVVLQRHSSPWFGGNYLPGGYLAVDFFYLLSGYVIAHAYDDRMRAGLGAGRFMLARLVRLYPLYAIAFVITALTFLLSGRPNVTRMALGLAFLPNFPAPDFRWFVPSSWSLFFELSANLVFALVHRYLKTTTLILLSITGFLIIVTAAGQFDTLDVGYRGHHFYGGVGRVLFAFPLGVAIYRHRQLLAAASPRWAAWPAMIVLMLALAGPTFVIPRGYFDVVIVAVLFPLLLIFSAEATPNKVSSAVMSVLGAISYALYILHVAVINFADRAWTTLTGHQIAGSLFAYVVIVTLLLFCLILDRFYDRPIRRLLTRLFSLGGPPASKANHSTL